LLFLRAMRPRTNIFMALFQLALLILALPSGAQERNTPLTGEEIRALISNNTVTGRHDDGVPFSEWHAPDGRVLGHNNREAVDNGCWDIRGDAVCYYYAGGSIKGLFCWGFRRTSGNGYVLILKDSARFAAGLVQSGNTFNHTDNGKPWTCEPLSSQRRSTTRMAKK
jgi:hypothetical protein